jgi:hypothetical protein
VWSGGPDIPVTHQTQSHCDVPRIRTGEDDAVDFDAVPFDAVAVEVVDLEVVDSDVVDLEVVAFGWVAFTFVDPKAVEGAGAAAATAFFTGFANAITGAAACGSTTGSATGNSKAPCGSASTSEPNTTVLEATLGTSGSGPTDVPLMLMPMTPR